MLYASGGLSEGRIIMWLLEICCRPMHLISDADVFLVGIIPNGKKTAEVGGFDLMSWQSVSLIA